MNESNTFFSRVGRWFKGETNGESLPLMTNPDAQPLARRGSIFRPWARRDEALVNVAQGFTTLTDLMQSIRENMERQAQRHDELMSALQQLPQALQSIPESNKIQSETLRVIHQQIENQNAQQSKLADILSTISKADVEQRSTLEALRDRVDTLNQHDQRIADNLNNVGSAMQSLSQNSHSSAEILQNMRNNLDSRDKQLENILHRQGTRFTTMLAVAIFLSIAALAAVTVMGYLGFEALNKVH
jgi:small-conductance mechanosensitive channel